MDRKATEDLLKRLEQRGSALFKEIQDDDEFSSFSSSDNEESEIEESISDSQNGHFDRDDNEDEDDYNHGDDDDDKDDNGGNRSRSRLSSNMRKLQRKLQNHDTEETPENPAPDFTEFVEEPSNPPELSDSSQPNKAVNFHETEFEELEEVEAPVSLEAQKAIEALKVNRNLQKSLRSQLKIVEEAQKRNEHLKKRMIFFLGHQGKKAAGQPLLRKIHSPFFADMRGQIPPDNLDTIRKKKSEGNLPLIFKGRKWTKDERAKLALAVRQQNSKVLMLPLVEEMKEIQENPEYSKAQKKEKFFQVNKKIVDIQTLPERDLEMNIEDLDWQKIAEALSPRTSLDCQIQWIGNDHPLINHASWTSKEDEQLRKLVEEHHGYGWKEIAEELHTNRTAFQCLRRYHRHHVSLMKSKWEPEEDQKLMDAVKKYGDKNWQLVASFLVNRTGQQCLHRWQKTLNPNIKRGKWMPEEDQLLHEAVKMYGTGNWVKIQFAVPGRTDVQCRERWSNVIDPDLNQGPWTEEEDRKLDELVKKHGLGKWSEICKDMHARTDNQCWRRWKSIHSEDAVDFREYVTSRKRRRLLPNYVKQLQSMSAIPDSASPSGKAGIVLNPQETESELKLLIKDALVENFKLSDDPVKNAKSTSIRPLPPSLVSVRAFANLMEAQQTRGQSAGPLRPEIQADLSGTLASAEQLKGRFQAMFLWPFLLGQIPMTLTPAPAAGEDLEEAEDEEDMEEDEEGTSAVPSRERTPEQPPQSC